MATGVAVAHVAFERQIGLADADLMGDVATNAGSLEGMSLVRHDFRWRVEGLDVVIKVLCFI